MTRKTDFLQKAKAVIAPILPHISSLQEQQDIIVFSHLRWDFVFQRPQHIVTRLAKQRKILFIEEPVPFSPEDEGKATISHPLKNITVMQPKIAFENISRDLPLLIAKQIRLRKLHNPILWFYSAGFSEIIPFLNHSLIVYDCMDELSAFQGASPHLMAQEKYLLSVADVVFTGGKSLYEEKRKFANHTFCFPSSVDQKHFAKANRIDTLRPGDIKKLAHPLVGFYGVIDERLDNVLLATVARSLPDVNFLMIGPVVKIDPLTLPQLPNIHYLGAKSYAQLPAYLKAIDIAMMPFALNEATKFISPTKTLEFMAAGKPIISTPITDVVRDYQQVIQVVQSPDKFVNAVHYYLSEPLSLKKQRESQYKHIITRKSWDTTVSEMQRIIHGVASTKIAVGQRFVPSYYPLMPRLTTGR